MSRNQAYCYNSVEDKTKLKIVIFKDYVKKGICYTDEDLRDMKRSEHGDIYKLPHSEYYIDYYSYKNLVQNKRQIVYIALPTGTTVEDEEGGVKIPLFTLQYLSEENVRLFTLGELTNEKIRMSYSEPESLGSGSYGEVTYYPHQDFVVKQFTNWEHYSIVPQDMIREIAVYRLFEKSRCTVEMKGFDVDSGKLFLSRGVNTLSASIQTLSKKQLPYIFFNLATCLRDMANQGVINGDLKPSNMVLPKKGRVRIIDWGLVQIDRSKYQTNKKNEGIQTASYRAPEIYGLMDSSNADYEADITFKVDVFSLGIIFLELFRGDNHFTFDGADQLIMYYKFLGIQTAYNINDISQVGKAIERATKDNETDFQSLMIEDWKKPNRFPELTDYPLFANLVAGMLNPCIKKRYNYTDIMSHPYFGGMTVPTLAPKFINNMPLQDYTKVWKEQTDLNARMRVILLFWLFQLVTKSNYNMNTFCLAVQILDMYVSKVPGLCRKKLQLMGATALLISAELCEVWAPTAEDLVYSSAGSITQYDLVDMEKDMINALNGNLYYATLFNYHENTYDDFVIPIVSKVKYQLPRDENIKLWKIAMLYFDPNIYSKDWEKLIIDINNNEDLDLPDIPSKNQIHTYFNLV